VGAAVDEILGNKGKYRARAKELAVEVAKGDALEGVVQELKALAQG
jgi:hypothetical protein